MSDSWTLEEVSDWTPPTTGIEASKIAYLNAMLSLLEKIEIDFC